MLGIEFRFHLSDPEAVEELVPAIGRAEMPAAALKLLWLNWRHPALRGYPARGTDGKHQLQQSVGMVLQSK